MENFLADNTSEKVEWLGAMLFSVVLSKLHFTPNSNLYSVSCSVPQGFVLEHLIFPIYIIDLPNASKKLIFYLFADDANIYHEHNDLSDQN